jgi:hypothetical protein
MSSQCISPEHRARELLNLVHLSTRCTRLPDIDEAERSRWRREARQAWDGLQGLLPELSRRGRAAQEVVTLARRMAADLDLPP